ncbi:hypothetical protein AMIS_53500 [Actinoplanes missouriensis 431]|uniref:Uncharacterized protein n=2 Tax=Actinoplanes missouriensis TaxID=1866 RepID=I0HC33_ACTM4|nr:hypothetical protein AMIS_53500 [Actinoplanes missouriensis 431]
MLMWVWIAVGAIALIVLIFAATRLLGRLPDLRRAAVKLQRRQEEAMRLQVAGEELQRTVLVVQQKAERAQDAVTQIKANLGR